MTQHAQAYICVYIHANIDIYIHIHISHVYIYIYITCIYMNIYVYVCNVRIILFAVLATANIPGMLKGHGSCGTTLVGLIIYFL